MEAVRTYTTQMMPSLKAVNFDYFFSVKTCKILEEGLLEHDHSVVNIQPLPQALSFSQGRGERLVMNRKGERDVWIPGR